jgi:hypothetical protein
MLALVNYVLFFLLILTILWLIRARVRRYEHQQKWLVATATFCGLELVRWCFMTTNLASEALDRTFFSDPLTYLALLVMSCPLVIAIRAAWRAKGEAANSSMRHE